MLQRIGPKVRTFQIGEIKLTQIADGLIEHAPAQAFFGTNMSADTFAAVCAQYDLNPARFDFPATVSLIETEGRRIVVDAGHGPGKRPHAGLLKASMLSSGIEPDRIDHVLISHMHRDHVGGLLDADGGVAFPGARHWVAQDELDYWLSKDRDPIDLVLARRLVDKLAHRLQPCSTETELGRGVKILDTAGHTPGHLCVLVQSGDNAVVITSDLANHPIWSIAHPDWYMSLDVDPARAAASRRRLLGFIADEGLLMAGYHMPFPALGHVYRDGESFRYVPLDLDG